MRDKEEVRTIINISDRNKLEYHLDLWITGDTRVYDENEDEYSDFDGYIAIWKRELKDQPL